MMKTFLESMGYRDVRQMPNGVWVGTLPQWFTFGLFVGLHDDGYLTRYCYEHHRDAKVAAQTWDGTGDPPGPWLKRKGVGGEARGPGFAKA